MRHEAGGEEVKTSVVLIAGALALIAAGCASTDPEPTFRDVQQTVSMRTGSSLRWNRATTDPKEIREAVDALLKSNLTAQTAVHIALWNNPSLQSELEEIGIARAELVQAGLLRNPTFSGSWRFPDRPPSGMNMEYSLAGNFLDLIMLPLRKRVAGNALEQTKLRVANEVLTLVQEVQEAFYTLQAQQQLLRRLEVIAEVNEAGAEFAKRLHVAGNITDLEYAKQQAVHAQSRVSLAQTRSEIRAHREQLNRLLGLWGHQIDWKMGDMLPDVPKEEAPLEKLEQLAIKQRLDLASSLRQLNLAGAELSLRKKLRFVPAEVSLGVSSERESEGQWVTGPTLDLELPIFDQGRAEIARLAAEYRQAQRSVEARAIDIRSEVREARDRLIAQRDLARFYGEVLLPQRLRIVNETLLQYNAMQIGTFELLEAKEKQAEAEREYVEAWRDYWIAVASLEKAVGGRLSGMSAASANTKTDSKAHEHHKH
jgi:outer membrane protein, heavy metal efflux system